MTSESVIAATRSWVSSMVIDLNLCPFARRVFEGDKIRYVVSDAQEGKKLLADLVEELLALAYSPIETVETTLLIHPQAFQDFLEYNDFLELAEQTVADLGLEGTVQVASFHPQYQFAETTSDAPENYTNRSPYPMLHLLREESISQVAGSEEEMLEIPKRNIEMLRGMGLEKILERLKGLLHSRSVAS